MIKKTSIVGFAVVSLVASSSVGTVGGGDNGSGGGGTSGGIGAGPPEVVGSPIILVSPAQASGSYSESSNKNIVSADLTFRANSAFFADGAYSKVQGHELKAAFGHTETGAGNVATAYTKNSGVFTGILSSAAKYITINQAASTLSGAQITQLNGLRTSIASLEANPTLANKAMLKTKYEELAALISYSGLQVSLRGLNSGNGYYGLFVNNDNGDYKQLSGIYALNSGKTVADYATVQGGGGTSVFNSKFSGAAAVSGIQLIDLKGSGVVSANYVSQILTGSFAVSNETNTIAGTIAFSGGMSANAGGITGLVFNDNSATYTKTKGELSDMTGGNAEAVLVSNGNSILGSVNITSGGNAVVGAFGGDK